MTGQELDRLDEIFTADALIDYTAFGGPRGDRSSTKAFLAKALAAHRASLHLLGQRLIVVEQDTATAKTGSYSPITYEDTAGAERSYDCGLYYHDRLVRTNAGWRIIERVEEKRFLTGLGTHEISVTT